MDVSEIIPSHLHIHRIIQMNKSFIIILLSFVVQYSAHGFTPVIDTPYSDMYHDTENMELLTLYTEIIALEQRYNAAVAREQSLANRMLGAAAIGAGGIGGMMLASGIAEQRADADAERDMAAYLATFKCNYGAGMTVAPLPVAKQMYSYPVQTNYYHCTTNISPWRRICRHEKRSWVCPLG